MSKKILILILILAPAVAFAGGQGEMESEDEVIVMKMAHQGAVDGHEDVLAEYLKQRLEEETNGKVEVRIFPAGQLGDEREFLEGVKLGTVELGLVSAGFLSNLVPEVAVISFPYFFEGYDEVDALFTGPVGEDLSTMLVERDGVRVMSWIHGSFRDMLSKVRIDSIEDFEGVKFRSPDIPVYLKTFQALGANPTPVPWTEVYQAMQTGVVDGMETTPMAMVAVKLYEVGDYVIRTGHIYQASGIVIKDSYYQSLPEDVQQAIDEVGAELTGWTRDYFEEIMLGSYGELEGLGMEIIAIDRAPLQAAVVPVWEDLAQDTPGMMELIDRIKN
jgi:TRAP-type transport system periplasmic protein